MINYVPRIQLHYEETYGSKHYTEKKLKLTQYIPRGRLLRRTDKQWDNITQPGVGYTRNS